MKYQIYLKKETSELVNKMADVAGTTPSHLLKILFEDMAMNMLPNMETLLDEIREQTERIVKQSIK